MSTFTAGTQYDDFVGTAAADRSDTKSLSDLLTKHNIPIAKDELVIGFRIVFGGNDARDIEAPGIVIYTAKFDDNHKPHDFQAHDITLKTAELFSYLKRFDMVAVRKGTDLPDDLIVEPNPI